MANRHWRRTGLVARSACRQRLEQLETRTLMAADLFALQAAQHSHDSEADLHFDTLPLPSAELLLAGTVSDSTPLTASGLTASALTAIPALNSLPGAKATVYLDFDGHSEATWGSFSNASVPVYSVDSDFTTFSATELLNIQKIWQQVAEDYAPFNVNVTTVQPTSFANGVALRVAIGGDGAWSGAPSGGISYINSFTNSVPNTAYVFSANLASGNAKYVADATSHEAGHAFGLQHQSSYAGGTKTEYYAGPGDGRAPIMGNSYAATRGVWWVGTPSSSSTATQDDVSIISRTANGFGYRPDDYADTAAAASALTVTNNAFSASGVISKLSDLDYFSFSTGAGQVSFAVNPISFGNNLDAKLELRDDVDTLIVSASPTTSFGATIATTLAAGAYRLVVASNGQNGDLGQYTLTGTVAPTATVIVAAPSSATATATSASMVNVNWLDNSSNEQGFRVESSTDNATWTSRLTVGANVTSAQVTGLAAGTTYYFRVIATAGTASSAPSNTVAATTWQLPPATPTGLAASASSASQINLSWSDVANETGYKIERSTDGVAWTQVGTTSANVTSFASTGLSAASTYFFRVKASSTGGDSAATNVASATTLQLPPATPTGLTATAASTSQINLSWSDVTGETGYKIERSTDGTTWTQIATTSASVTSYVNTGLAAGTVYYYRVKATNVGGDSAASTVVSRATLSTSGAPVAPTSLTANATSTNQVNLSWRDNATNETGYRIEYSMNSSTWYTLGTVGANVTAVQVTGTAANTTYYFRVRAVNSAGVSAPTNIASVRTPVASLPVFSAAAAATSSETSATIAPTTGKTSVTQAVQTESRFAGNTGRAAAVRQLFENADWLDSLVGRFARHG